MKQRLYAMMDICCRESLDHDAFQQEDGPTLYPLVDDVSLDVLCFYCVKPIWLARSVHADLANNSNSNNLIL